MYKEIREHFKRYEMGCLLVYIGLVLFGAGLCIFSIVSGGQHFLAEWGVCLCIAVAAAAFRPLIGKTVSTLCLLFCLFFSSRPERSPEIPPDAFDLPLFLIFSIFFLLLFLIYFRQDLKEREEEEKRQVYRHQKTLRMLQGEGR